MSCDPVRRRRLGRTAIEVTQFGLGTAPLGGFRAAIPDLEAESLIVAACAAGVNFFDTSPYYGYGRSELRLGAVLRNRPRDSFVLSTKVGRWMRALRPGESDPAVRPGGLPGFAPTFDYSYDGTMRSLEQSHLRLGLARIDVALIHDVDLFTTRDRALLEARFKAAMEGAYRALAELRAAGVVGAIGCGLNETGMCLRFARAGDFDCMLLAGRYTLLEQGALSELMPECARRGIGVILGGPFNSGILAGPVRAGASYDYADAPPEILERARAIEAVCRRHLVPLAAAALQFPLAHPQVCTVIPGARARTEVEDNLLLMRAPIPPELWRELKHKGLLDPAAPVPA